MPFDLVDLNSCEIYGPFNSHKEAKESATRSGFKSYAIWENGNKVEIVGVELLKPKTTFE